MDVRRREAGRSSSRRSSARAAAVVSPRSLFVVLISTSSARIERARCISSAGDVFCAVRAVVVAASMAVTAAVQHMVCLT